MKRNIFFFCFFAFLMTDLSLKAQLFVNIEGGYNFDFLPNEISDGNLNTTIDQGTLISLVRHSYGNGLSYGGGIGYRVNERIHTGLIFSYLSGFEGKTSIINATSIRNNLESGSMIRIRPEIQLYFALHNKWNLYSKLGCIIGVNNKLIIQSESNNSNSTTIKNGGLSFGILNEIGVSVKMSPKVNLNFGVNLIVQSYAPKKSEITASVVNGVNNLDNILVSDRFVIYQNEYQNPLEGNNLNEPSLRLKKYSSFSSLGVKLCAVYNL